MGMRTIKISTFLDSDDHWVTSILANGYSKDPRENMTTMLEDLVRALVQAAPGNRVEVSINGHPVEIGGEQTPDWLKKIIG